MSFPGLRQTLVDSVFATLGEDACWDGVADPVRVRRAEYDDDARFGATEAIVTVRFVRVRKREVPSPAVDQVVTMVDAEGEPTGEGFRVIGEPRIRRNLVWVMAVERIEV